MNMMTLNTKMNRAAVALVLAVVALTGCSTRTQDAAEAADKALRNVLNDLSAIPDPWVAFFKLKSAEESIYKEYDPCRSNFSGEYCEPVPVQAQVKQRRILLLTQAIEQAKPQAFDFLYSTDKDDDYAELRKASVNKLLAYVEKSTGESADAQVLWRAGQLMAQGDMVVRNTGRAADYFALAWAAGEKRAANSAALTYLTINDVRNAYLWSLRCTTGCERYYTVQLVSLQQKLSPEAARQAEGLAGDPSAVQIDSAGGQ